MPYFTQLGLRTNAGARELHDFIDAARQFLHDVLTKQLQLSVPQPDTAPALFEDLRQEALAVYLDYVYDRFEQLHEELNQIDGRTLDAHGLIGEELRCKLHALTELEASARNGAAYWPHVGTMLQELDLTLDSVLNPLKIISPRVGTFIGLFKEFRRPVLNIVNG